MTEYVLTAETLAAAEARAAIATAFGHPGRHSDIVQPPTTAWPCDDVDADQTEAS